MQKNRVELPPKKAIYSQIIEYIEKQRTFLLFKGSDLDSIAESTSYANAAGFNLIGVAFNTHGLKDYLKSLRNNVHRRFGVFNVSSKKETRIAINAGASFIFSTHCDRGIIRRCNRETVFNSIGCLTPTEVAAANEFGAKTISVFPCNKMGGVSWFVFLQQIFPKLRLIPTDTMDPSEASQYLREGAYAVAPIIDLDVAKDPGGLIEDFKTIR